VFQEELKPPFYTKSGATDSMYLSSRNSSTFSRNVHDGSNIHTISVIHSERPHILRKIFICLIACPIGNIMVFEKEISQNN